MTIQERTESRRKQGESLYRQRFNEYGLSKFFEFIERDWQSDRGRKCVVECKACGHRFSTYNVYAFFRGKIKGLCCPECGMKSDGSIQWTKSAICDEVLDYYQNGHTINETSEKFGVSIHKIENRLRILGIKKTTEQRKKSWANNLKKASAKGNESQKIHARERLETNLSLLGFDIVKENNDTGVVKCRKCGCVFERTLAHLRHGNVLCPTCEANKKAKIKAEEEKLKEEQRIKSEAERIAKNPLGLSYYRLSIQEKYDVVRVCEVCGNEYTVRDRTQNEHLKYCRDNGCCSQKCARKRSRIKLRKSGFPKNHLHRAHKYNCEYDGSVTLKKLLARDGMRCAICGELCDQNDHSWTEHFGPTSPTIDHIVPLSKGGSHTWNNVQVAHAICNCRKGDKYEQG